MSSSSIALEHLDLTQIDHFLDEFYFVDKALRTETDNSTYKTNRQRENFLQLQEDYAKLKISVVEKFNPYIQHFFQLAPHHYALKATSTKIESLKEGIEYLAKDKLNKVNEQLASFEEDEKALRNKLKNLGKPYVLAKKDFEETYEKLIEIKNQIKNHHSFYLSPSVSLGVGYFENSSEKTIYKTFWPLKFTINQMLQNEEARILENKFRELELLIDDKYKELIKQNQSYLSEKQIEPKYVRPIKTDLRKVIEEKSQDENLNHNFKSYDIASITKLLVSLTFMKVWQNYYPNIPLEKPIKKIKSLSHLLPYIPANSKLSIYHLLTHQSGLSSPINQMCETDKSKKSILLKISESYNTDPNHMIGDFAYRDANLILVAYILQTLYEKQFEKPFTLDQILQKEMFEPLHMTQSKFVNTSKIPIGKDTQIVHDPKSYICFNGVSGHAGIFSTTQDLVKLGLDLIRVYKGIESKFGLTKKTLTKITKKDPNGRGLGVDMLSKRGTHGYFSSVATGGKPNQGRSVSDLSFGHSGFTGANFWVDLKKEVVLVSLSNSYLAYMINGKRYRIKEWSDSGTEKRNTDNKNEYLRKSKKLARFIFSSFSEKDQK